MSRVRCLPILLTAPLCMLACADGGDPSITRDDGRAAAGEPGLSPRTGPLATNGVSSGVPGTVGAMSAGIGPMALGVDPGGGALGACIEITEVAMKQQAADIIFVIDNSDSMTAKAASVKANMNQFSSKIIDSGVDAHVVLISAIDGDTGMCIDPPLGGGGCPAEDSKLPTFFHIDHHVGSNNALEKLLDDHDEWKDHLRPEAIKHIVVVSDDDSDLSAKHFDAAFKALDPTYKDYRFHAIVGQYDAKDHQWCDDEPVCCDLTEAAGEVYLDLIEGTDGVHGDLCTQDFAPVFDTLSSEVIQDSGLACEWAMPEPMGEAVIIDLDQVNVDFDDGMGGLHAIGKVATMAGCADAADGWYYDDPDLPTKLLLCLQTCDKIQLAPKGSMSIQFGCKTIFPQ